MRKLCIVEATRTTYIKLRYIRGRKYLLYAGNPRAYYANSSGPCITLPVLENSPRHSAKSLWGYHSPKRGGERLGTF